MQLKPDGFPPFVVNIWFVGTPTGVISATRHDGGYWGERIHANPNATIRIGDAAYEVTAREIVDDSERKEMVAAYVGNTTPRKTPGMTPRIWPTQRSGRYSSGRRGSRGRPRRRAYRRHRRQRQRRSEPAGPRRCRRRCRGGRGGALRAGGLVSARAARIDVRVVPGDDVQGLAGVMNGASSVVHLSGILIESRTATYEQANVAATETAVAACLSAGVPPPGAGQCDRRRPALREPLSPVQGRGRARRRALGTERDDHPDADPARPRFGRCGRLVRSAGSGKAKLLGGGRYVMRPLDLDDLSRAILGACRRRVPGVHLHELAGPEPVAYRDLIERVAAMMGREVSPGALPIWVAKLGAAMNSRMSGGGVTPAVIDVITANEHVAHNADADLGITLTPLAETLAKILPWRHRHMTMPARSRRATPRAPGSRACSSARCSLPSRRSASSSSTCG